MPKKISTKKTARKSKFTAKTADKHDLYQRSVQDAETEIYFINRAFKKSVAARRSRCAKTFAARRCSVARG